MPSKTTLYLAI